MSPRTLCAVDATICTHAPGVPAPAPVVVVTFPAVSSVFRVPSKSVLSVRPWKLQTAFANCVDVTLPITITEYATPSDAYSKTVKAMLIVFAAEDCARAAILEPDAILKGTAKRNVSEPTAV